MVLCDIQILLSIEPGRVLSVRKAVPGLFEALQTRRLGNCLFKTINFCPCLVCNCGRTRSLDVLDKTIEEINLT